MKDDPFGNFAPGLPPKPPEVAESEFMNLGYGSWANTDCPAGRLGCLSGIWIITGEPCRLCRGTGLNLKTHLWQKVDD